MFGISNSRAPVLRASPGRLPCNALRTGSIRAIDPGPLDIIGRAPIQARTKGRLARATRSVSSPPQGLLQRPFRNAASGSAKILALPRCRTHPGAAYGGLRLLSCRPHLFVSLMLRDFVLLTKPSVPYLDLYRGGSLSPPGPCGGCLLPATLSGGRRWGGGGPPPSRSCLSGPASGTPAPGLGRFRLLPVFRRVLCSVIV